jgi:hypothetical protein
MLPLPLPLSCQQLPLSMSLVCPQLVWHLLPFFLLAQKLPYHHQCRLYNPGCCSHCWRWRLRVKEEGVVEKE